jgi:hypothetical protein
VHCASLLLVEGDGRERGVELASGAAGVHDHAGQVR